MGESKKKLAKREELHLSCAGVQTIAGRVPESGGGDGVAQMRSVAVGIPLGG